MTRLWNVSFVPEDIAISVKCALAALQLDATPDSYLPNARHDLLRECDLLGVCNAALH